MGKNRLHISSVICAGVFVWATSTGAQAATTIYVKASAVGANNGDSWTDAYTSLQSGLARAASGDQIWVAAGTYKPTIETDRTISFQLKSGVAIYGGFAGTEPASFALARRNFVLFSAVLSGDLLGDDAPDFANTGDNSHSVVSGDGVNATAILDGFTITAGQADAQESEPTPDCTGGGMFLNNANPTIRNCRFIRNRASLGGGAMSNISASPVVSRCAFEGNRTISGSGGAVLSYTGSMPEFSHCTFLENGASNYGGAVFNVGATANVLHCAFHGNTAEASGGAVYEMASYSSFINCLFTGNKAENHDTPPIETNGGAIVAQFSATKLINCTLWQNTASAGGGLAHVVFFGAAPTMTNCILWDNPGGELYAAGLGAPLITHSDVKDTALGGTNIDADPLFADADGPDGVAGTPDDNLHLLPGSPCIDIGNNAAVPSGVLTDLMGAARFFGAPPIVDLGAYEFVVIPCDADYDGDVDGDDFIAFKSCAVGPMIPHAQGCAGWDFDDDNDVDMDDFAVFQRCYRGVNAPADPHCAE